MLPFLCVVIACGAVSGFHCLVASGTTPKQIRKEGDCLFVGYGSMILESALAVLVIVAVAAGIGLAYETDAGILTGKAAWNEHYASWMAAEGLGSKIAAVVTGSANMLETVGIPQQIGIIIMGVFIASFAGTTLDTATRIQRYVISELATDLKLPRLANRWVATAIAVASAGTLAFATGADGKGAMMLWPMFGAVNQLLAGLALLVITVYLRRKSAWKYYLTLLPCVFMLIITMWAMVFNEINFISPAQGDKQWVLIIINGLMIVLALGLVVEACSILVRPRHSQAAGQA